MVETLIGLSTGIKTKLERGTHISKSKIILGKIQGVNITPIRIKESDQKKDLYYYIRHDDEDWGKTNHYKKKSIG